MVRTRLKNRYSQVLGAILLAGIATSPAVAIPTLGLCDFDIDGDVDHDDLAIWQIEYSAFASLADGDGDGDADGHDFLCWQEQYGAFAPVQTTVVPEPTGAALLAVALATACGVRWRRTA